MDKKAFRIPIFAVLLGALLVAPAAQAAPPPPDDTEAEEYDYFGNAFAHGDFNGDGFADLAIGTVGENVGRIEGAGAVEVIYGSMSGLTTSNRQFLGQGKDGVEGEAELSDHFGSSLAAGDFDGDGYHDLAIGVPAESDIGIGYDHGAVNVIYGSASGLSAIVRNDQFWHQNVANVEDVAEANDRFGGSLAAGDFNYDGFQDLAIGVPGEDLAAGIVHVLFGSPLNGLSATYFPDQVASQALPNMGSLPEADDWFGSSLAAGDFNGDKIDDLAIGVYHEDIGPVYGAGAVNVLYGTTKGLSSTDAQFWHQDVGGVAGVAEESDSFGWSLAAGDFDGDKIHDLAIGVPWESEWVDDGGVVHVAYGSTRGLQATELWHQDIANVEDVTEAGDLFGWSLATGDIDGNGFDDLAVGAPYEDIDKVSAAGAVNVIYGSSAGLDPRLVPNQFWHQDVEGVEDVAGAGDRFAGDCYILFGFERSAKLVASDFNADGRDDLGVGVPCETLNSGGGDIFYAGAVNVIYGWPGGLNTVLPLADQFLTQAFLSPPVP